MASTDMNNVKNLKANLVVYSNNLQVWACKLSYRMNQVLKLPLKFDFYRTCLGPIKIDLLNKYELTKYEILHKYLLHEVYPGVTIQQTEL